MSQQARDHADAPRGTPRRSKPPQPAKRPTTLGECEVGRIVTVRMVVTGNGSDGWRFVRPIHADGSEGAPLHLPGEWPLTTEGE